MGLRFRVGTSQRIGRRTRLFEGVRISQGGIRPYVGISERVGRFHFSVSEGLGRHARRHRHHYLLVLLLFVIVLVVLAHVGIR